MACVCVMEGNNDRLSTFYQVVCNKVCIPTVQKTCMNEYVLCSNTPPTMSLLPKYQKFAKSCHTVCVLFFEDPNYGNIVNKKARTLH